MKKSTEKIGRKKETGLLAEHVLRQVEQVKIEEEVSIVAHERII